MALPCKWQVQPVNIVRHDDALQTRVRFGVGFRASCNEGYRGPVRASHSAARADGKAHRHDDDARYAEGCGVSG